MNFLDWDSKKGGVNNIKKAELVSVRKEDYEGIVKFLSNFEDEGRGKNFWENRLLFWWDKNPAFDNDLKIQLLTMI